MKLRVSKQLHARMRARADILHIDLSQLVERCVKRWEDRCGVALPDISPNATREGSTVLTVNTADWDAADLRPVITWALDRTETQATPLDIEDVEVEYVK